jgi:hypothetical protein
MKKGHPKHRSDIHSREIDKDTIVLDRAGGQIHQLNKTASFIWKRLDSRISEQKISAQYASEFKVDLKTAKEDVARMIQEFCNLGLLEGPQKSGLVSPR